MRDTTRRARFGLSLSAAALSCAASTAADPQWNTSISAGIAGVGGSDSAWERTQFFGALGGDVLLLRQSPGSIGVGPSLAFATAGFSDFRIEGGAMALFPLGDLWAVGAEPGAYVRFAEGGPFPGLSGRAWFGIQTFNYHGSYAPRGGLSFGYAHDLGASDAHAIVIAAEIDGLVLALPVILLYESLRGHPEDD